MMSESVTGHSKLFNKAIILSLTLSMVLWAISLSSIQPENIADYGLVSVLSVTFYISFAVLISSFVASLYYYKQTSSYLLACHLILLVVMLHALPPLVYGTLRYSWAWKHLGVVDYINRHGAVDFNIRFLSAYHNWPGFFTLNNFLSEVAGIDNALGYAQWAPLFFNLLNVGASVLISKVFTNDKRVICLGAWFFVCYNWVGQDYFAPQSLGYFLHIVVIVAFLRWFTVTTPVGKSDLKKFLFFDKLVNLVQVALRSDAQNTNIKLSIAASQKVKILTLIVIIFLAMASTHQLTPFLTILSLLALVISLRTKLRLFPILLGLIAVMWIVYVASGFTKEVVQSTVESLGQVFETLEQGLVNLNTVSDDQRVISLIGRIMTVSLWGVALLGILRRIYNRHWDISIIMIAFAPFVMVVVNSYGGEMIFRAYYFTVPFMSYLVARLFFPIDQLKSSIWHSIAIGILSTLVLIGFLFAHYGKDRQYYFSPDEVQASQYLFSVAPENSLIIEMSRNYPGQFINYEWYTTVPIDRESSFVIQEIIDNPESELERWLSNSAYADAYFIVTRSQIAAIEMLGTFPDNGVERIEGILMSSPLFYVFYESENVRIYKLIDSDE